MKHFSDFTSGTGRVLLPVTLQTNKSPCLSLVCPLLPPHTQQWIGPVPEGGGLLLHQDLLRDRGCQLHSSPSPAGSGPGLIFSVQLGFLWFSAGLGAPDPPGSQAQVQLQLRARPEQTQSPQPVGSQQLLADSLRASLSGGCSSVAFGLLTVKTVKLFI